MLPYRAENTACPHVFCYHCISSRLLADAGFCCPLCGIAVKTAVSVNHSRRVVAIQADGDGDGDGNTKR